MSEKLPVLEAFAITLYDIEAIRFGRFKFQGKRSPLDIDLRILVSYPDHLRQAAKLYAKKLDKLKFDILAAFPYAGLPIGVATSLQLNVPLVYPRKVAKSFGPAKQVEGVWDIGQRAILIEDQITTGKSILEAIATLKAAGLQASETVVLIDREQGGKRLLKREKIAVHSLLTLTQLLAYLEKHERISSQRRAGVLRSLKLA